MAAVLRAVEQELHDLATPFESVGYVLALSLARTIDADGSVSAVRELRMVMQDLRTNAPVKIDSKSEELRKRRDARR